jgi:hypothetical protein
VLPFAESAKHPVARGLTFFASLASGQGAKDPGERQPDSMTDKSDEYEEDPEDDQNWDEIFHESQARDLAGIGETIL